MKDLYIITLVWIGVITFIALDLLVMLYMGWL